MPKGLRPGTPAPKSGQVSANGGKTESTVVQGKPLPPTPKPGQTWVMVDQTKHKND